MPTTQLNASIDVRLKAAINEYCRQHGELINHFVQEALFDRLEELQDIDDLKQIRHEPTRSLSEVIKELGHDSEP